MLDRLFWLSRIIPAVIRGLKLRLWVKACGGQCGMVFVDKGFDLRSLPHSGINIGNKVAFGPNVKIFVPRSGKLVIGDGCVFTSDSYISAYESVHIGNNTMVAEYVSIRDADHKHSQEGVSVKFQGMEPKPIWIGDGVWIASRVAVLKGAIIESWAVIGANAVVNSRIPQDSVAVGVPARVVSRG
jgi:acetyltransferase-like isoleucine patch superfamily enzyme